MITLDGSILEGGGQLVRTALALSTLTRQPFTMTNIRANRPEPGLKPQHLSAIKTLQKLTNAQTTGAQISSTTLTFEPGAFQAKNLEVDIETAGSITLLLQSLLLPLLFADKRSKIIIHGGTNVQWSMPAEYFTHVILPRYQPYADKLELKTIKRGYYPAGQGIIELTIKPKYTATPANITTFLQNTPRFNQEKTGQLLSISGISHASIDLENARVAERQAQSSQQALKEISIPANIRTEYTRTASTGSGITLWAQYDQPDSKDYCPIIVGADALGEKNKPAEIVGKEAAQKLKAILATRAPVDHHAADNLIPLISLQAGNSMCTNEITLHTRTNIWVAQQFLKTKLLIQENCVRSE